MTDEIEIVFSNSIFTVEERRQVLNDFFKQHREVLVKFTKVDGTVREMPCTLHPDLLPKVEVKEGAKKKEPKTEVMGVFCTDKQEWRSFRVDNVISVTPAGE
jgi:hypothetical protein